MIILCMCKVVKTCTSRQKIYSALKKENLLIIARVFVNTPATTFFQFFPFSYSCGVIKNWVFFVLGLFIP